MPFYNGVGNSISLDNCRDSLLSISHNKDVKVQVCSCLEGTAEGELQNFYFNDSLGFMGYDWGILNKQTVVRIFESEKYYVNTTTALKCN